MSRCAGGCQETRTPSAAGTCVRCGHVLEPWVLTESFVRAYYEAIGAKDATEEALGRLRAGGEQYGWTDYLGKDNVQDAREEIEDAIHRAIFLTLKARKRTAEGGDPDAEATITQLSARAAQGLVEALRIFETIRDLER